MWLLRFHFAVSVLCLITFYGFVAVFKETIKENGWLNEKKSKKVSTLLIFFVPIMNVLCVLCLFIMIFVKKQDFDKMCKEASENSEV